MVILYAKGKRLQHLCPLLYFLFALSFSHLLKAFKQTNARASESRPL